MLEIVIFVIYFPFLSFVITFFFGNYLGRFGCFLISIWCLSVSLWFVWLFFISYFLYDWNLIMLECGSWFKVENLCVNWNFLFDGLSIVMLVVVISVSAVVHLFSYFYMYNDPYSNKFMSFISLFTFFMVVLVLSSNFMMLFLGWEGVGLCSFLLISFWSSRVQAVKSAIKAMLINRIGDFFILGGILLIFGLCKSVDFFVIFSQFNLYLEKFIIFYSFRCKVVDLICLLLFLGAITKSAQIFFHGWLPDAMEGPTPVSALIHAATMVTAGIFLIIRCSYIFEYSPLVLELSVYFGVLTIVTFSLIGLFQNDIKKIIAYSTCSQLGYMILSCGLSSYNFALFHLFNHAFFKALLFLSAGSIIHFMNNEQDLRRLNGVFRLLPMTSVCVIIGSLSLSGFPFLSGFYSKDAILEILFYKYKSSNIFIFLLAEIGVVLTSIYSLKIVYYLLFKRNFNYLSNFKWFRINYNFVNNFTMFNFSQYFPLFFLAIFSIFSGFFFKNLFLGLGENFFFDSIFILPVNQIVDFEFISHFLKLTTIFFVFISLVIFWYFFYFFKYFFYETKYFYINRLVLFFNKRGFFDSIFNIYLSNFFYYLSYKIFFILDKGFVEIFGPYGLSKLFTYLYFSIFKVFSSGKIDNYLVISFFSIVFFFLFFNSFNNLKKMIWLQLIIMNFILIFFINTIFCFNRTVYVLLSSLVIFLFTSFTFIFFEFEFLGLMFATVYVGGIAVMFLFLILTVDVRVENNEKVFLRSHINFWKIIFPVIFSVFFSFVFLWFCDPMMFASMDFYLFCNKKILFSWNYSNEPIYLVHQGENLFSHRQFGYTDFSSLVYSEQDAEYLSVKIDCDYTPFSVEFFLDYFVYNDYIDDVYTLGVLFFFYHSPLLVLIGLFLLVTTIVAVIVCLNIFG